MAGSPNFLAQIGENVKRVFARKVVWGLLALVVVGAGAGWAYMNGMFNGLIPSSNDEPVAAAVQSRPAPAPAKATAAPAAEAPKGAEASKGAPVAKDAKNAGAGDSKNAKPSAPAAQAKADGPAGPRPGTPVHAASTDGAGAPVVTAVPQPSQAPGSGLAHVDEHLTYQYNALGRRDPFQSLVDGAFVGADVGGDAPPDPGGIKVVGIVWGATDQFALVEDVRGNSYVLRKGDKVQNGYVEALKRDAIVVTITSDNQSQSVEIPLERKGDQNAR